MDGECRPGSQSGICCGPTLSQPVRGPMGALPAVWFVVVAARRLKIRRASLVALQVASRAPPRAPQLEDEHTSSSQVRDQRFFDFGGQSLSRSAPRIKGMALPARLCISLRLSRSGDLATCRFSCPLAAALLRIR